jgi:hypothetical protein
MALVVLADSQTPNPQKALAKAGLKCSDGLRNTLLLAEVSHRLGLNSQDRENRDKVQLPLREVGLIGKALFDSQTGTVLPDVWKGNSNYCLYRLRPETVLLLSAASNQEFEIKLKEWLSDTPNRITRIADAEASAAAMMAEKRLVPLTIELYCARFLPEYEVVFVDDNAGGDRIPDEYKEVVQELNLPLHRESRWPDIVLYKKSTGTFWIVDCVESDGEVDYVRRDEIIDSFMVNELQVDGFTTAYRTIEKFKSRQKSKNNIADNTFVWIMDIGGSQFQKIPAPDAHDKVEG